MPNKRSHEFRRSFSGPDVLKEDSRDLKTSPPSFLLFLPLPFLMSSFYQRWSVSTGIREVPASLLTHTYVHPSIHTQIHIYVYTQGNVLLYQKCFGAGGGARQSIEVICKDRSPKSLRFLALDDNFHYSIFTLKIIMSQFSLPAHQGQILVEDLSLFLVSSVTVLENAVEG